MTLTQAIGGYEILGVATAIAVRLFIRRMHKALPLLPTDAEEYLAGGLILIGWPVVWLFAVLAQLVDPPDDPPGPRRGA